MPARCGRLLMHADLAMTQTRTRASASAFPLRQAAQRNRYFEATYSAITTALTEPKFMANHTSSFAVMLQQLCGKAFSEAAENDLLALCGF